MAEHPTTLTDEQRDELVALAQQLPPEVVRALMDFLKVAAEHRLIITLEVRPKSPT
jgi:hypothetical protein